MARASGQGSRRLANQILDVVREARFEQGHHLREQQLADLLGVSRTPVRVALNLLAEEGIVEARKNQGFFLLKPFDVLQRIEFAVSSTVEEALYERLVNDRLAGDIPDSLTQTEIAKRYKVDRVTLLRALARMAEDGLVERNRGHGWTFLPTLDSVAALHGGYNFRLIIEPANFLLPSFKVDRPALERSRLQHLYLASHPDIAGVSALQLFETDAAFHEMFAEFGGNAFLLQAIQQQNRLRKLLEFAGYVNRRRVRDWCNEHLAIIDAVAAGRLDKASQLMHEHLAHADQAADAPSRARSKPRGAAAAAGAEHKPATRRPRNPKVS
ncbi:GntR family transcriptional regulator [Pseudomonas typographi]|uniref:GntR family transcriptional regulator n=1 Tax=Pseudomonas typographi TaxID=2715964 RepID=A0ABR7Z4G1_9PSED|nr:GntR family transcriptional regulator [Pseudomonas typographi]MBD1588313.1 GntR family transcriptional regulator [Pseudomonas typographi]MBD1600284.1 GntR family transcriptional regulator [Pseudomonas typographi]